MAVSLTDLYEDFPELTVADVAWEKEIYAHFGLLYMGFALLEHSLINAATMKIAIDEAKRQKIRKQEEWQSLHELAFAKASSQTIGNLIKVVSKIREFSDLEGKFSEVKRVRDYFSHHFFRREAAHMSEKTAALLLLVDMREARLLVDGAEVEAKLRYGAYTKRMGWPEMEESYIQVTSREIRNAELSRLNSGTLPRGVDRWLNRGPEE